MILIKQAPNGVPQGSILSPVLFRLYITNAERISFYADDTHLSTSVDTDDLSLFTAIKCF